MTLEQYLEIAASAPLPWMPDPFRGHAEEPWEDRVFSTVVSEIEALLARFDRREVTEQQLLHGKDNDKRLTPGGRQYCNDVLSHWLYYHHHPGSERWKLLGQRYWSVEAWLSWREKFLHISPPQQFAKDDGLPHLRTLPKRKSDGAKGLLSEHVVPKRIMKDCLLSDRSRIAEWLKRNLCCVVTIEEDARLVRDTHVNPADPWQRYRNSGIILLHNPAWKPQEIADLLKYDLLDRRSVDPLIDSKLLRAV
jgi:hypothetical protein